jgi:cytoskeletal protein RodZ
MGSHSNAPRRTALVRLFVAGSLVALVLLGAMAGPTSAQGDRPSHTITITAAEGQADYRLRAAVALETSRDVELGGADGKEGLTAAGTVTPGESDTYRFEGPVTLFETSDADAITVSVDGEVVDPTTFESPSGPIAGDDGGPPRTIAVYAAREATVEYALRTSAALSPSANINPEEGDSYGETSASGRVAGGGVDTYYFNGELTEFAASDPGTIVVYLDGRPLDRRDRPRDTETEAPRPATAAETPEARTSAVTVETDDTAAGVRATTGTLPTDARRSATTAARTATPTAVATTALTAGGADRTNTERVRKRSETPTTVTGETTAARTARRTGAGTTTTGAGAVPSGVLGEFNGAVVFVLLAVALVAVLVGMALLSGQLERNEGP